MKPLASVQHAHIDAVTRRHFFQAGGLGLGTAALGSLMQRDANAANASAAGAASSPGLPGLPHFAPKAKRAIWLFMAGAPCQMDMWDHKPEMADWYDKDLPEEIRKGQRLTTMTSGQARFPIAPSMFKFAPHGQSGKMVSELIPHMAAKVDDISLIHSVWTEAINHDPAITYICTGNQLPGRPSMGSWLSYGLGNENDNLPSFVVMTPKWFKSGAQALYNRLWGNGFLPSKHQGVALRSEGDPVLYLSNPDGVDRPLRRRMLDSLGRLNQAQFDRAGDPETLARIAQYEMAFRMQASVPELTDISGESKATLDLYGPEVTEPGTFANSCLRARRMAERGVRFVQIFHRGWDQHGNVGKDLPGQCGNIDQPCAGLLADLEQRGLLEDTLVIWGGEFGRTIYSQGGLSRSNYGRDHHPKCFTYWLAGAGIKKGHVHGKTDEFCYNIDEDPVHIRDLNATILNRLGIDSDKFSVPFQGLDQRLTGVEGGTPVDEIFA